MKWHKSWSQELDSTLWQEEDIETRLIFYGLRLLAGRQDRGGKIKFVDNEHIARLLNIPLKNVEKSFSHLISSKRIYIRSISDGYMLTIAKWWKYQQDTTKKMESQNNEKSPKKESQNNDKRRLEEIKLEERRGEESLRGEEKNNLPPIPKNLEFKLKDKLKEMMAQIRRENDLLELSDEELFKSHRATKDDIKESLKKRREEYIETIRVYRD